MVTGMRLRAVCSFVLPALVLLAGPSVAAAKKVQVRALFMSTDVNFIQQAVKDFNKSQDRIHVTAETQAGWRGVNEKVAVTQAAGKPYDVIEMVSYNLGSAYKWRMVQDLGPYIKASGLNLDQYVKYSVDAGRISRGVYGLPIKILPMVSYYGLEQFKASGLVRPPLDWVNTWTWEDFVEISQKISAKLSSANRVVPGSAIEWNMERIGMYLNQNGADLFNPEGTRSNLQSTESLDAFKFWMRSFSRSVSPSLAANPPDPKSGGLMINGTWQIQWFNDQKKNQGKWGILPLPKRKEAVSALYVDFVTIGSGSKVPKEAFEFIRWLMSKQGQDLLLKHPIMGHSSLKAYVDKVPGLDWMPADERRIVDTGLDYAKPYRWALRFDRLNDMCWPTLQKIQRGMISPEAAIEELSKAVDLHLKTVGPEPRR